jgi:PleD family two-component response regulator
MSLNINPSMTTTRTERTLGARDGKSGLELYKSHRVDCIVTELYLPDTSGYELLVEVVPHASKPSIAIIMVTRAVWRNLNELALHHGV